MANSTVQTGIMVPVATPALHGALGYVQVASLWREDRPVSRFWRAARGVPTDKVIKADRRWVTNDLPAGSTGRFK